MMPKGYKRNFLFGRIIVFLIMLFAFTAAIRPAMALDGEQTFTLTTSLADESAHPLTNLAGKTECGNMGDMENGGSLPKYKISSTPLSSPTYNSDGYEFDIDTDGFTVFRGLKFSEPVAAGELSSITITVKLQFWGDNYGHWGGKNFLFSGVGIYALGLSSNGASGCLLSPLIVKNTEYKWEISGNDLFSIADVDGYLRGIRIAAGIDTYSWDGKESITLQMGEIKAQKASGFSVKYIDGQNEIYKLVTGSEILPQGADGNGVFIGWTTDPLGTTDLYFAKEQVEINKDTDFYAVKADYKMTSGACVRKFTNEGAGLRFEATISKTDYSRIAGYIRGKGIIMSPAQYWRQKQFTLENATDDSPVLNATVQKDEWVEDSERLKYYGSLRNVNTANYSVAFGSRGYLEIESSNGSRKKIYTPYAEESNARSMYYVARAHANPEEVRQYIDGVADITISDMGFCEYSSGNTWVSFDGKQYNLTLPRRVYSVIVNGQRLSLSNQTKVMAGEIKCVISAPQITHTANGSEIRIALNKAS